MSESHIRNFAIIAHIDHGKSTLADRLLELTGTVAGRDMQAQILDSNPIERERGITIKLAPVRMLYVIHPSHMTHRTHETPYILNLIDTPGHVDFSYEVSRSLAACEGAILVVDASQGVQAQTVANLAAARKHNLTIIPVINKIDLPNARIGECVNELRGMGFEEKSVLMISAKTGEGVPELLNAIPVRIPPPRGESEKPLRALVFSSQYDPHKGVVVFVRVVDGDIGIKGLTFYASGAQVTPIEVGYFSPQMIPSDGLRCGEVGYIATGLKDIRLAKVGDTITHSPIHPSPITPLPGYQEPKPMVFLGLFPIDSSELQSARDAMEKLRLSDSAFSFRPIASAALGNGFHCGFLGLLHAEIVQERLVREFGITCLPTIPSVEYHVSFARGGLAKLIQSASEFPDPSAIEDVREPVMRVTIYTPKKYIGAIMQLSQEKRGEQINMVYHQDQVALEYLIPLSEMIIDYFDRLKAATEGYASLDYEFFEYQSVQLAKLDIVVNHENVDALSFLAVADQAQRRGREIVERLAGVIPRQQFTIPIQAAIGGAIIARADVKAFRKDVTAKLYGGDRTRKDKLLKKQAKGKAKMKMIGKVEIPQAAFFEVLKRT